MDQGIIASFKAHYRRHFVQHGLLRAMEKKEDVSWTVLDAIYGIKAAWKKVTPATIAHCFRHCGFQAPAPQEEEEDDPEDDIPLAQLIHDLRRAGMAITPEEEEAYHTVDDQLLTSAPLTVQDIAQDIRVRTAPEEEEEEEEDQEDPVTPAAPPTLANVMDWTSGLKDALASSTKDTPEEMWEHLSAVEAFLTQAFTQKKKQATILSFFSAPPPPATLPDPGVEASTRL